jgi:hypothetical protein
LSILGDETIGRCTSMIRNNALRDENQEQFTAELIVIALRIKFYFRFSSVFQINKPDIFVPKIQYFCVFSD